MMAEIVAGTKQLSDRIQKMLKLVDEPDLTKCLMAGGLVVERRMKENVTKQNLIDTGNLRAHCTAEPEGPGVIGIGPRNVIYAAIHEFGGVIRAVKAKFLAIPVTDAARQTGSPRKFAGKLHAQVVAGSGALVDEGGDIQYALRYSVTIPARPYARPALDEHVQEVEDAIAAAINKKIGAITG